MHRLSKNAKSYKAASILFSISGLIFMVVGIVSIVTGGTPSFLPIGIALVIISIGLWQQSKKITNNNKEKP